VLTIGWPTLSGSRTINPDKAWSEDAPGTARLRESGAVLIGKTTMPEFAWKVVTDSPLSGITRNPWNPDVTPGGSSGGAAAATAAGKGVLALATDGGGSIRVPSSRCGLVGMKPTFGRVPDYPPSRLGTNSRAGPITRTVRDCALMLNVITKPDPRDWYGLPVFEGDYMAMLQAGVRGMRLLYSRDLGSDTGRGGTLPQPRCRSRGGGDQSGAVSPRQRFLFRHPLRHAGRPDPPHARGKAGADGPGTAASTISTLPRISRPSSSNASSP
jgi:aspartyl-tRNA(Asn)/glutamyl-tRNA(Gln) amidotransferase subunit A